MNQHQHRVGGGEGGLKDHMLEKVQNVSSLFTRIVELLHRYFEKYATAILLTTAHCKAAHCQYNRINSEKRSQ